MFYWFLRHFSKIDLKNSDIMSAKALVEKCMLRKINKREKQISTLPSFISISQGNTKELKGTQGCSRELI